MKDGKLKNEIVPIEILQRKGKPILFDIDEFPRAGTITTDLSKLRSAFKQDESVTASNASAIIATTASAAHNLGLKPLAHTTAYAKANVDLEIMRAESIPASRTDLRQARWTADSLDLIESDKAFATQAISANCKISWDTSKVNVNGGAIALSHPIGASGSRILVTLLHKMVRRDAKKGLATLCIDGSQSVASAAERDQFQSINPRRSL